MSVSAKPPFLAFVECAGCGEMFPVRKKRALNRAKWCSERCRKRQYGDPCIDCGARTRSGAEYARVPEPRCATCSRRRQAALASARHATIAALRAEGLLNHEIAERLETTRAGIANTINHMRNAGEQVARTVYAPSAARRSTR